MKFDNATDGLMGLLGGGQSPTTPPQGGGMFDAYSPQNQTNMQMAMIADMIGNFAGKDVGAMKTMMPLAENARKLRLQNEQRTAAQNMLGGGGSSGGGSSQISDFALLNNFIKNKLLLDLAYL